MTHLRPIDAYDILDLAAFIRERFGPMAPEDRASSQDHDPDEREGDEDVADAPATNLSRRPPPP